MESFARRGVRTTVAVAGLAALGVGLAAPTAFALPSVPDVSGVGNPAAAPTDFVGAAGALPQRFQFTPPAAERSTQADATPSTAAAAEPADEETTESEGTGSTEADESTGADDTESTPEAPQTRPATPGLLPSIPGSPVAAQASPQVSGVDPSSALQSLDSAGMF